MAAKQRRIAVWTDTIGRSTCRDEKCRKPIIWAEIVASGRKMCFEGDAVELRTIGPENNPGGRTVTEFDFDDNHWRNCPGSKDFKARPKTLFDR